MASPDLSEPIYEIVSSLSSTSTPTLVPIMIRHDSSQSSRTPSLLTPSSSTEGSPNNSSGILRHVASSNNLASTISFAPLPVLEPRKRTSSAQLGVAARGQMLRHRRALAAQGIDEVGDPDTEYYSRKRTIWDDPQFRDPGLAEDAVEDAFIALGKMVKGAGKNLWRKVSLSQKSRSAKTAVAAPGVDQAALVEGDDAREVSLITEESVLSDTTFGSTSPSDTIPSSTVTPSASLTTTFLGDLGGEFPAVDFVDEPSEIADFTPKPPEPESTPRTITFPHRDGSPDSSSTETIVDSEVSKLPPLSGSVAGCAQGECIQATIISIKTAPDSSPPPQRQPSNHNSPTEATAPL